MDLIYWTSDDVNRELMMRNSITVSLHSGVQISPDAFSSGDPEI
jgi:hypothetical protein